MASSDAPGGPLSLRSKDVKHRAQHHETEHMFSRANLIKWSEMMRPCSESGTPDSYQWKTGFQLSQRAALIFLKQDVNSSCSEMPLSLLPVNTFMLNTNLLSQYKILFSWEGIVVYSAWHNMFRIHTASCVMFGPFTLLHVLYLYWFSVLRISHSLYHLWSFAHPILK
jgi:hypothetical protein